MDRNQAENLGRILRERRTSLGLSVRQFASRSGVSAPTISRIELGQFSSPAPDKLARLADALGLELADVYALAEYAVPNELPTLKPYLRSKYRDLPQDDVDAIERYAAKMAKKHGINLSGPAPGEDEQ